MDLGKYRALFLAEAREHVDGLAVELELGPPFDRAAVDSLFRHAHSVKGMSASMGVEPMRLLAHAMEDRLGAVRREPDRLDRALCDSLLAATDYLARQLDAYGREQELPPAAQGVALLAPGPTGAARPGPAAPAGETGDPPLLAFDLEPVEAEPSAAAVAGDGPPPEPAAAKPAAQAAPAEGERRFLRVERRFVDALLEQATDLHLAHGRLQAALGPNPPAACGQALEDLRRALSRLREDTLAVRLLPFEAIVPDLARTVRDTAQRLAKPARLEVDGGSISVDRSVVEALFDPLVHLIRNAIDHGLEPAADRAAAGKPPQGQIRLTIQRAADAVLVTLADDGRGMDPDRLVERAIEAGILSAAEAARLDRRGRLRLATMPGLSTARTVSDISGRGVGLDLVRSRIEAIGGRLDLETDPGRGTSFTLRAPLTLALQRLLVVEAGGRRFALPIACLVAVGPAGAGLPSLAGLLGQSADDRPAPGPGRVAVTVETAGGRRSIAVDLALGERELVVRPLGRPLGALDLYAAAALLPDGGTALVLDPEALAARLGPGPA